MTCAQPCNHFRRWMAAEAKAGQLRSRAEHAEAECQRLANLLARVGERRAEPEGYRPPDTRLVCSARTALGPCGERALEGGLCASHTAEEVLP